MAACFTASFWLTFIVTLLILQTEINYFLSVEYWKHNAVKLQYNECLQTVELYLLRWSFIVMKGNKTISQLKICFFFLQRFMYFYELSDTLVVYHINMHGSTCSHAALTTNYKRKDWRERLLFMFCINLSLSNVMGVCYFNIIWTMHYVLNIQKLFLNQW